MKLAVTSAWPEVDGLYHPPILPASGVTNIDRLIDTHIRYTRTIYKSILIWHKYVRRKNEYRWPGNMHIQDVLFS